MWRVTESLQRIKGEGEGWRRFFILLWCWSWMGREEREERGERGRGVRQDKREDGEWSLETRGGSGGKRDDESKGESKGETKGECVCETAGERVGERWKRQQRRGQERREMAGFEFFFF